MRAVDLGSEVSDANDNLYRHGVLWRHKSQRRCLGDHAVTDILFLTAAGILDWASTFSRATTARVPVSSANRK